MDLTSLRLKPTTPVHLKHPGTGELLYRTDENGKPDMNRPMRVIVHGPGSKKNRAVMSAITSKQIKRGRKAVNAKALEEDALDKLQGITEDFENLIDQPFTPELARAIYADPEYSWLREQVEEELGDHANFLETPSTN